MRPALHVPDALTVQFLFKPRHPAPGGVLAALVGQDLPRRSMLGNGSRQGLQHQGAPLVVRHHQAHQVARMVIQKRRHIYPLVPAQQEREQIRLPKLIRFGALETSVLRLGPGLGRLALLTQARAAQDPAHRRLRSPDAEEALHHVPDPAAARLRIGALRRKHRLGSRIEPRHGALIHSLRSAACQAPARRLWISACSFPAQPGTFQPRAPTSSVLLHPALERHVRNAQLARHLRRGDLAIHHRSCRRELHIHWPGRTGLPALPVSAPLGRLIIFRLHSIPPLRASPSARSEAKC